MPPVVTLFSCMASSSADCVLGGVRLISSAKITFENIGPLKNRNDLFEVFESSSIISVPVISDGIKSGVNCILLNFKSKTSDKVFINKVFAKPGTPSSNTCPLQSSAIKR